MDASTGAPSRPFPGVTSAGAARRSAAIGSVPVVVGAVLLAARMPSWAAGDSLSAGGAWAAMAVVACGVSLLGAARAGAARGLARLAALAVVVAVISAQALWALGVPVLGLDPRAASSVPAFSLAVASLGVLLLGVSARRSWPSEWLGLACASVSGLSVIGDLSGDVVLGQLGAGASADMPMRLALMALGIGIIVSPRGQHRIPSVLRDPGPAGYVARRLLPATVLVLPLLGALGSAGEHAGLWSPTFDDVIVIAAYTLVTAALTAWAVDGVRSIDSVRASAERELAMTEERFASLVAAGDDGVLVLDPATLRVAFASPGAEEMIGSGPLVGRRIAEVLPEADPALALPLRPLDPVQTRLDRPDGSVVHIQAAGRPLLDGRVLMVVRDVTAQVAAHDRWRRLLSAVDQSQDAIVAADGENVVQWVNAAFERASGWSRSDAIGRPLADVMAAADAAGAAPPARLGRGPRWTGDATIRTRAGGEWTAQWSVSAVDDGSGKSIGTVSIGRDLREQRALEAELRQAQKLEAIGQLASGIAHDFNNLLTAIRGYADFAEAQLDADAGARDDIRQVVAAADRASALTRQLLAFARKQNLEPTVLDPAAVVHGMAPLLRRLLGEHIEVVVDARQGAGMVTVDAGQLEQVVLNLAVNARDAMPAGGTLAIRVAEESLDADAQLGTPPGRYVALQVADTGHGIDEGTKARIFEPFFTTKGPGSGTGMGLATVHGIVKQSGGHIDVESAVGVGTTFTVYLPVAPDAPCPPAPGEQQPWAATEADSLGARILLVEDNAPVREFAMRVLSGLGHTVIAAPSGGEAMRLIREQTDVDALVTDVRLPGPSGYEVARALRDARPDLPVVFMSGFADAERADEAAAWAACRSLGKPFRGEQLAAAVGGVLADRRRAGGVAVPVGSTRRPRPRRPRAHASSR